MENYIVLKCPGRDCDWKITTGKTGNRFTDRVSSLEFAEDYLRHLIEVHGVVSPDVTNYEYRNDNHGKI